MTICAECKHFGRVWVTGDPPWSISGWRGLCAMGPVDYVSGARRVIGAGEKNTHGECPDFSPRGTAIDDFATIATDDEFRPNPDVDPLPFEDFERGLIKPLFPLVRAWFRALWDRIPSAPEGGFR